jgi:hypothetical protein
LVVPVRLEFEVMTWTPRPRASRDGGPPTSIPALAAEDVTYGADCAVLEDDGKLR